MADYDRGHGGFWALVVWLVVSWFRPGAGDGIKPGTISWVSTTLSPGSYELVCNLPGHYAAGMYTILTAS